MDVAPRRYLPGRNAMLVTKPMYYLKCVFFSNQTHSNLLFKHFTQIFSIFGVVFPNLFATYIMFIWLIVDNSLAIGNPYAVTVDKYSGTNVFL